MEVESMNPNANYPGSLGSLNDESGIDNFWSDFDTEMVNAGDFPAPGAGAGFDMIFNDLQQGDFVTDCFQTGLMAGTITPQETYFDGLPQQASTGDYKDGPETPKQLKLQSVENAQERPGYMDSSPTSGIRTNNTSPGGSKPSDKENGEGALSTPKKSKRGRKKGKRKLLSEQEQTARREKFLARNRQAATKCRNRKKQWMQGLEGRAETLCSKQQELIHELRQIEKEKRGLQLEVTEHAGCGSPIIQEYLRAQAIATANQSPRPQYSMMKPPHDSEFGQGGMNFSTEASVTSDGGQSPCLTLADFSDDRTQDEAELRGSSASHTDTPKPDEDAHASRSSVVVLRKASFDSARSEARDSGISNMGTPDKLNFQSFQSDEGFAGEEFIKGTSDPQLYDACNDTSLDDLVDHQAYSRSFG